MSLEPSDCQVQVAHRSWVTGLRRLMKVDRDRQDSPLGQGVIQDGVVGAIAAIPGAAVDIDKRRKRSDAARPVYARQPRLACKLLVFDVLDVDFVSDGSGHALQRTLAPGSTLSLRPPAG